MAELTTIVGFIAGVVTTTTNLPQVWKTYRNKPGEGLSFRMLLMLGIGVGLWNSPLSGDARFSACSSAKS